MMLKQVNLSANRRIDASTDAPRLPSSQNNARTSSQLRIALALPHSWKTDAQCVKSPKLAPRLSMSCSSTRDSREASLGKSSSQSSLQCISKEISEPITPADNLSQSNTCCEKKTCLFSLFNSMLYSSKQNFNSTDTFNPEFQELKDTPITSVDVADITDEEAKKILGQDLADMILVNATSDSVRLPEPVVPKTEFGVRQIQIGRKFVPKIFVPTRQWMPTTQPIFDQVNTAQEPVERTPKHEPASCDKKKRGDEYMFPDGGWECSKCQNYNFKGRKNCHRCKKAKSSEDIEGKPEHMRVAAEEKAAVKAKNRQIRKKQKEIEKGGDDWVCQQCFNHNYSFREVCNRCSMTKADSKNQQQQMEMQASIINTALIMN